MKSGLKRSALGLLLLPLLGAAGCSAQDPSSEAAPASTQVSSSAKPAPSPSSPGVASPTAAPGPGPSGHAAETSPPAEPAAVEQSPQAAPEPTFAPVEEQFLTDRVPEGTDPNAVLQVGQEHCDKLVSTRAVDAEAVLSELIMNPSQDTSDAISTLCRELLPELEAAARGFPDGVFSVGAAAAHAEEPSIEPGTYRAYGLPGGCSISIYAGSGELIASSDGSAPVTIAADAARVESDQCYSWFRS